MSETAEIPKGLKLDENTIQELMSKFQKPAIPVNFVEVILVVSTSQAILDWMIEHKAPSYMIEIFQTFCWGNLFVQDSLKYDGQISKTLNEETIEMVIDGLNALGEMGHRF